MPCGGIIPGGGGPILMNPGGGIPIPGGGIPGGGKNGGGNYCSGFFLAGLGSGTSYSKMLNFGSSTLMPIFKRSFSSFCLFLVS